MRFLILSLLSVAVSLVFAIPNPRPSSAGISPSPTPSIGRGVCNLTCDRGSHLFLNPNDKCECVLDVSNAKSCSVSSCSGSDYYPRWRDTTSTCICLHILPDPDVTCIYDTKCLVGSAPVWDAVSQTCACEQTISCSAMVCISEKHAVYNSETKECSCEWIEGFGPIDVWESTTSIQTIPTNVNATSTPTQDAPGHTISLGCEALKIYCPSGDHAMHLDPITKKCKCGE